MELQGKTAIVTGGGRGIGKAISLKLAAAGADVAILYRKKPDAASETIKAIEKLGRKAAAYECDVADVNKVNAVFAEISKAFGAIYILVNNAGLASWGNFIHDTTPEEWDKVMKANIYGPYHCVRAVLPGMRKQKSGHIVSISSVITQICPPTGGPYAVAKSGLETLTKVLAREETSNGIHVNAIGPGLVETDMGRKLVRTDDMKKMYPMMPFGRVCQPDDIANMVHFLVTPAGSYIQGQVIYINGGQTTL